MLPQLVLVADDHEEVRRLIATVLEGGGYRVSHAADGLEAVDRAAQDCPALILMDLMMPVMDGWEATRRIRATPATAEIPVVAVTAEDHRRSGDLLRTGGFNAYLGKPFRVQQLLRAVELGLQGAAEGKAWVELPAAEGARRR